MCAIVTRVKRCHLVTVPTRHVAHSVGRVLRILWDDPNYRAGNFCSHGFEAREQSLLRRSFIVTAGRQHHNVSVGNAAHNGSRSDPDLCMNVALVKVFTQSVSDAVAGNKTVHGQAPKTAAQRGFPSFKKLRIALPAFRGVILSHFSKGREGKNNGCKAGECWPLGPNS